MTIRRLLTSALLVLLVTVLASACTDGRTEEPPAWSPGEPVTQPRLFAPGVVSTEDAEEFGLTFSPDGREVFFTRRYPRESRRIWTSRWEGDRWSEPEVAPFAQGDRAETPWMAPDGRTLYFASRRPGAFVDLPDESDNLWVVERDSTGWGVPRPVRGEVNRPRAERGGWPEAHELNPALGPDGALYYWSELPGRGTEADILRAEPREDGSFGPGEPLRWPVNTEGAETHFAFGPGGVLVFQSYGLPGSIGYSDLYVTFPSDEGWSAPRALPEPVNSSADELFPSFSPDGRYLFFGSDRATDGDPSIWFVEWAAVDLRAAPTRP